MIQIKQQTKQKLSILLKSGKDFLLDILFPRRCPLCDQVIPMDRLICEPCSGKLPYLREPLCKKCGKSLSDDRTEYCRDCSRKAHSFRAGRAVFSYEGRMRESLYRFKYANRREYGAFYGEQAAILYGSWIKRCGVEAVIPVPLHRKRRQKRGYNQAEIFARELADRVGLPVRTDLVSRVVNTRPQKELDVEQRRKNLKKAFTINRSIVQLRKVLLVDDIYTTGSTVDAVTQVLRDAGVEEIYVLCISIGGGY
ncbi:MAG: double zinc ribbon domain-containing protein [Roseburia sp.]